MSLVGNLRVVVHQVRSMDNLGAIARLMANFGFSDLWLSDPRNRTFAEAERMAVHAGHILEGKKVAPNLREALAGTVYAVGSTSRDDLLGRRWLSPEEAIASLAREAERGPVALVLGGEQRGLSDEELAHCQDVLVIPTSDAQPSMNLAQAASVLLYLASREQRPPRPPPEEAPPAHLAVLQALEDHMQRVMLASGFLNPQQSELILRELKFSLFRARLSRREAELWLAAFKQLDRVTKGTKD